MQQERAVDVHRVVFCKDTRKNGRPIETNAKWKAK